MTALILISAAPIAGIRRLAASRSRLGSSSFSDCSRRSSVARSATRASSPSNPSSNQNG